MVILPSGRGKYGLKGEFRGKVAGYKKTLLLSS